MAKKENISMSVIRRLPRYYRFLSDLKDKGIERISSKELSEKMGLTASQIRQDLNCFGEFGQQGYGYPIENLQQEIGNILGISTAHPTILIGAGNLGRAVATHISFNSIGFELKGIFDKNKSFVGRSIQKVPIYHIDELEDFCKENEVSVAILCIPREATSEIAKRLYALGVRNYWNFSHYDLSVKYEDVVVENVHLNDSLMTLCYRIRNNTALQNEQV